jgi:FKBP-type peptidyl-prolyl cis-trans isomerase FklB
MNLVTPLRTAILSLSILSLPLSATAEDQGSSTQPETVDQAGAATQPQDATETAGAAAYGSDAPAEASKEDVSFSIGYTIGSDMTQRGVDIDADQFTEGIRAGLGLEEGRLTPDQVNQALYSFQMQMQQQHLADAKDSLDRGLVFLTQNAEKQGVTVTDSGLQYKVLKSGDGATPTIDDVVAARYRGALMDGTEFDSSPGDEPVPFPVARVIPGWVEALQLMKVGDKWELVVPASLAYGENGTPDGKIGPNEVLVFEIELVEIK